MSSAAKAAETPLPTTTGNAPARRVAEVEEMLRQSIASDEYPVGSRLPTESQLTASLGVSRSVLREAVAALRAEGLLKSRQGAGVYVLRKTSDPSPLSLLTSASKTMSDVIEELELRTAVEIEAASLAAQRGSPAQMAALQTSHEAFGAAVREGRATEQADAEFHLALARATNNSRFVAFLAHLGERTIPRAFIRAKLGPDLAPKRDLELHGEHQSIVDAVLAQDVAGAREAMRNHLGGSMARYRKIIHGLSIGD